MNQECPKCEEKMIKKDTTYSNIIKDGVGLGQHTGNIYYCEECEEFYIDNFLSGYLEVWEY